MLQTDDVIAFVEEFWQPILFTSIALSYSNFTASAIEIWNKAKAGQKQIFQKKDELMSKCRSFNQDVNSMQGVWNVAAMITADSNEHHDTLPEAPHQ